MYYNHLSFLSDYYKFSTKYDTSINSYILLWWENLIGYSYYLYRLWRSGWFE